MKKKNILVLAGSLALVAAIGVGSTLAYFTDNDSATNVVTMGNVNIDLEESDGTETSQTGLTYTNVVPGDELKKQATVKVGKNSEDCYVRVKIDVTAAEGSNATYKSNVEAVSFMLNQLNINKNLWYNEDTDMFYYQDVLKAGQSFDIFDTVTIPTTWGNEAADQTFDIAITVEAIQADHFTPERTEENKIIYSWGYDLVNKTVDQYKPAASTSTSTSTTTTTFSVPESTY